MPRILVPKFLVHVRYVCIALFILFMSCILFEKSYFLSLDFLLKFFLQVFYGDDRESTSLLFCLGNSEPLSLKTSLILPHMLGLDIVSFSHSMSLLFFCLIFFNIKKNIGGEDVDFFFLIAFQISYVFLPDISVHCALIEYAYI
jgi:hypothetical protein